MSGVEVDKPILNYETFSMVENEISAGIPEIMLDLIDTYLEDSDKILQQLTEAVQSEQFDATERFAHSLKSTAATFGAEKSAAYFSQLETMAREGAYQEMAAVLDDAQAVFAETRELIVVERNRVDAKS